MGYVVHQYLRLLCPSKEVSVIISWFRQPPESIQNRTSRQKEEEEEDEEVSVAGQADRRTGGQADSLEQRNFVTRLLLLLLSRNHS